MKIIRLVCLSSLLFFPAIMAAQTEEGICQKWAMGINVAETAGFMIAKQISGWSVTFIPIHLDGSYMMSKHWGLGLGVVYRYENYGKPLKRPFGETSLTELWTNYNELFLMAGPKYSFSGQGNEGLYASFKAGLGGAISPGGYAVTVVGQPEFGYSWLFGKNTAFWLDVGLGVLLNMPLVERPRIGFDLNAIGWLVHRTTPIFRVALGIAF